MRHFLRRALQHKRLPRSIRGLAGGVLAPAGPPGLVAPTRLPQRPPPRRLRTGRAAVHLTAVAPTADTRLPPTPTTHEHPRRLHREALPRRGTGAPVPTGEMLQALLQQRRLAGRGWAVGGCVRLPPSFSSRIRALFSSTCPRSGQTSEARANFAPRTHADPPSGQVRIGFRRDSGIGHKDWKGGIELLRKAKAAQPKYAEAWYWWRDLAVGLFHSRKYRSSARAYGRAFLLGGPPDIIGPRLADSWFYAGEIAASARWFRQSVGWMIDVREPYWGVKARTLPLISDFLKDERIRFDYDGCKHWVEVGLKARTASARAEAYLKAVTRDPSNNLAWYNYASALYKLGKREDAAFCRLIAAVLMRTDAEAWALAVLALWVEGVHEYATVAFAVGLDNCGTAFLSEIEGVADKKSKKVAAAIRLVVRAFAEFWVKAYRQDREACERMRPEPAAGDGLHLDWEIDLLRRAERFERLCGL